MHLKTLYNKLNIIANKLGVKIIRGKGNFKGGSCVIKEKSVIVINSNKPFEDRIKNLALGLLEFDLSSIEIDLKIKKFLDEYKYIEVKNEK
jgi:hypothetical protein